MFKSALPFQSLAIATAVVTTVATTVVSVQPAQSQSIFGEEQLNQSRMVAVAVPLNTGAYSLLVVEQIEGKRQCWSESGANPTLVDPLLLNFDFTGSCRRSTDSNGYSMRINGEDLGLKYLLRVSPTENGVLLIASPSDRSKPEILIGRSNGMANGFLKLNLLPGWQFTRRTYDNKPLGHYYFSADGSQVVTLGSGTDAPVVTDPKPPTEPDDKPPVASTNFTDISGDIYRAEIEQAVNVGFIAGFNDNTFRPQESLTREQLVSMAIESLQIIPESNINVPQSVASAPYPDVAANRWSAAKIAWAKQNNIISGYKDGTFKPTQQVTRAELMAILRRTAEYAQELQGKGRTLQSRNAAFSFVDLGGHWASDLTTTMSTYCRTASPFQETGDRFLPDQASKRNYAAAATLRAIKCAVDPNS